LAGNRLKEAMPAMLNEELQEDSVVIHFCLILC
jgi:hypothetical protein